MFHLKFARHIKAGHGGDGGSDRSTGHDGEDKYIEVPLGTVVRDKESNEILFEITEDGEKEPLPKEEKADWGTGIFAAQPTKHQGMHNPVCQV